MGKQRVESVMLAAAWLSALVASSTYSIACAQEELTYETIIHDELNISISGSQLPWAQAVNACEARNQKLATVETPEKDDIFVQLFLEHLQGNITLKGNSWVSATEVREGVWQWASLNKPLYYSRWFMDGQPDDKENLNCVYLASTAYLYWRDANCSASMYYICESPAKKENDDSNSAGISLTRGNASFFLVGCLFSLLLINTR